MNISNNTKAALWMLGAIFAFTAMALAGREMASELDTFEIMMYRSLIGLIIILVIGGTTGTLKEISTQRFGLQFIRNICHFTGQNMWFYAVAVIPFAQVFAFEFSTPIWVAVLAPFFLGEQLTKRRLFAVVIGFIGILIISQPGSITLSAGVMAAAICAIFFAGVYIATKKLSETESITSIVFWMTAIQLVLGMICTLYDAEVTLPSNNTIVLLTLVGSAGLLAHYCIVSALKIAPVIVVSPIDFLRLPIIAFIGAGFYSEAINIWVIIGAVIVFVANFTNVWFDSKVTN